MFVKHSIEEEARTEPEVGNNLADTTGTSPNPIDLHVGRRIRLRRTLQGVSLEALAKALGLSFQQLQKYERGTNRVSASRLFDLSRLLDVPVSFFFDALDEKLDNTPRGEVRSMSAHFSEQTGLSACHGDDVMGKRETLKLVRAYYGIQPSHRRKFVLGLIQSIAGA